jgi:hypothetical protein
MDPASTFEMPAVAWVPAASAAWTVGAKQKNAAAATRVDNATLTRGRASMSLVIVGRLAVETPRVMMNPDRLQFAHTADSEQHATQDTGVSASHTAVRRPATVGADEGRAFAVDGITTASAGNALR